jgi:ParB-like chromosome segregation protein Spo0J
MRIHPLCDIFPAMADAELKELAADIKANGQREIIFTLDDMILDGRNRFAACKLVKLTPKLIPYDGKDPLAFVLSKNLHRRHLTESQRAMVAAKLAGGNHGNPARFSQAANLPLAETCSQTEAAEKLNVGERTVRKAKKVLKEGTAEDIKKVESGEKTVTKVIAEIEERKAEPEPEAETDPLKEAADTYCAGVREMGRVLDEARRKGEELAKCPVGVRMHWQSILHHIGTAKGSMNAGMPSKRCPYCKATGKSEDDKACKGCKGFGYVDLSTYKAGCAAVGSPDVEGEE